MTYGSANVHILQLRYTEVRTDWTTCQGSGKTSEAKVPLS